MEKNVEDTAVTGSKVTVKIIMVVLVRINEVSVFGFIRRRKRRTKFILFLLHTILLCTYDVKPCPSSVEVDLTVHLPWFFSLTSIEVKGASVF